jgi:hypothetical protein
MFLDMSMSFNYMYIISWWNLLLWLKLNLGIIFVLQPIKSVDIAFILTCVFNDNKVYSLYFSFSFSLQCDRNLINSLSKQRRGRKKKKKKKEKKKRGNKKFSISSQMNARLKVFPWTHFGFNWWQRSIMLTDMFHSWNNTIYIKSFSFEIKTHFYHISFDYTIFKYHITTKI